MSATSASGIVMLTCEYSPFPGGIGTYSGALAAAVREAGFTSTVIAPSYPNLPPPPPDPDTHRILKHHRIEPAAALRLLTILRQTSRSSILLAADIRSVLALYLLRPMHRRSYRVMVHGSEASKFRPRSLVFHIVRRAYLSADFVIFNSEATRGIFEEGIGRPQRSIVAYLGIEPHWFEPVTGTFDNAELSALPKKTNIVCSVGRIESRKGQLETVRVLAQARDLYGFAQAAYVIAGIPEDCSYAAAVLDEGRRLNVPVIAPGRLSDADLKRLYQRAICHSLLARSLPGKLEGFGLVLLEAGAQACPSVATATGGIPEVLGQTGSLIPVVELDAAARAIAAYAKDPDLRAHDGAAARQRARRFTWAACAHASFPELNLPQ